MMDATTLDIERDGGIVTIRLNRPDAKNALDRTMAHDLMIAAIACDEDPGVRAVVLTGAGEMFCPGGDIKFFAAEGTRIGRTLKEMTGTFHAALSRFARMNAPLIVAVNGVAAGAGMSLALAGDLVYAARAAQFTMAYTKVGLSPDGGSTYFLPRLVGLRRAQELALTNRTLSAEEALDWGLVTRVVDDAALAEAARATAERLAAGSLAAHGSVKRLLADSFAHSMETQMELESREVAARAQEPDGQEGLRAFAEKRAPKFEGAG